MADPCGVARYGGRRRCEDPGCYTLTYADSGRVARGIEAAAQRWKDYQSQTSGKPRKKRPDKKAKPANKAPAKSEARGNATVATEAKPGASATQSEPDNPKNETLWDREIIDLDNRKEIRGCSYSEKEAYKIMMRYAEENSDGDELNYDPNDLDYMKQFLVFILWKCATS